VVSPDKYLTDVAVLAANLEWVVDTADKWIGECPACKQRWTSAVTRPDLYKVPATTGNAE